MVLKPLLIVSLSPQVCNDKEEVERAQNRGDDVTNKQCVENIVFVDITVIGFLAIVQDKPSDGKFEQVKGPKADYGHSDALLNIPFLSIEVFLLHVKKVDVTLALKLYH